MQVLTMSVFFASSNSRAPRKIRVLTEKFRKVVGPRNKQPSLFSNSSPTKLAEVLTNVMSTGHDTQNGNVFSGLNQWRKDTTLPRNDCAKAQINSTI